MFDRQQAELWERGCWEQAAFDVLMAEREDADRQKRINSGACEEAQQPAITPTVCSSRRAASPSPHHCSPPQVNTNATSAL
jgi:hypothetical protein